MECNPALSGMRLLLCPLPDYDACNLSFSCWMTQRPRWNIMSSHLHRTTIRQSTRVHRLFQTKFCLQSYWSYLQGTIISSRSHYHYLIVEYARISNIHPPDKQFIIMIQCLMMLIRPSLADICHYSLQSSAGPNKRQKNK